MRRSIGFILLLIVTTNAYAQQLISTTSGSQSFPIVSDGEAASIYVSEGDHFLVNKAAELFRQDINKVTGKTPELINDEPDGTRNLIVIGSADSSKIIQQLVDEGKLKVDDLRGKWEAYKIITVDDPFEGVDRALVIAGSDRRGTAYGVFTLSRQMGVSPLYWWADVPVKKKEEVFVKGGSHFFASPKVKYRGIFINDEAPALSGWVNEKFGQFNHEFYEKVFELILRYKGNFMWPAMWGRMFNVEDSQNPVMAEKYGIVMGTSHHEPLMRAHAEWDKFGEGAWNYQTNDSTLREFWRKGMERMDDREGLVTIGMRGDGDKPMSDERNIDLLEKIVADQRKIIEDVTGEPAAETPQVWALYKEVQEYYDQGMEVPDDVTLLFSDDNWGDIRRLPQFNDSSRAGGYGVYYHFDYVGGPRSYKWINTNPLPKIWQQMNLAYQYNARQIWIVNVGDIKPMEFPISFFLDFAWNPEAISAEDLPEYTRQWAEEQFGEKYAGDIAKLMTLYGKYNSRRKPELLSADTYSLVNYREAERVVKNYNELARQAEAIYNELQDKYESAFYQLVLYPVKASANLNEMYVTLARNQWYAGQGRTATNEMAAKVHQLFEKDAELADYYNTEMADGKWNHFMDQSNIGYTSWDDPDEDIMPKVDSIDVRQSADMGVAVQGSKQWWPNATESAQLPDFNKFQRDTQYVEIFNRGRQPFNYTIDTTEPWLQFSETEGKIDQEKRIWVSINWDEVPAGTHPVPITISGAGKQVKVQAVINNPEQPNRNDLSGFVENNGYISMEAAHFSDVVGSDSISWQVISTLGRTLSGVAPMPVTAEVQEPGGNNPHLEYRMHLQNSGKITVQTYMSPTLDVHGSGGLRYAVSVDDKAPKMVTLNINENNRSWGEAVSRNIVEMKTTFDIDEPGEHTLKFWMVDPGIVLQKIVIDTGGLQPSYLGPPESFYRETKNMRAEK